MKLQIFVLTAGNPILFETLEAIKKNVKVSYDLCVWYHNLNKGDKLDIKFYEKIFKYTDDVIMANRNQGCPAPAGYAFIYKDFDYILYLNDDHVVKEGAMEKMLLMYSKMDHVAYIGEGAESNKMEYLYEVSNPNNLPDWGGLISRDAINDVGAIGAFFPSYGFDFIEWQMRLLMKGWRIVNYKGLFEHGGKNKKDHETAHKLKDFRKIQGASFGMYHVCERFKFINYKWWTNKI